MAWMLDPTTDPLADVPPPRYAVESDEEEDEFNPLSSEKSSVNERPTVQVLGDNLPTNLPLIFVSGEAGAYWSRGAATFLGEQLGGIFVNSVQIGLIFPLGTLKYPLKHSPPALVVSSELFSKLPVWAMYPFVRTILDALKPSRIALLDTYSLPTYISNQETSSGFLDPPLRYLTNDSTSLLTSSQAKLFNPPNLLSSTCAALLSLLSTPSQSTTASLLLLPSKQIPPRPPKAIEPSSFDKLSDLERQGAAEGWSKTLMQEVTNLLIQYSIGGLSEVEGGTEWKNPAGSFDKKFYSEKMGGSAHQPRDIGEGAMYI